MERGMGLAGPCDVLGRLLAQGLVRRAECTAALEAALVGVTPAGRDPAGFRTRLMWDLFDAARGWRVARRAARERVAWALEPALDRRAPRRVLLAVARRADRDGALTGDEREAIALAAVQARLRPAPPRFWPHGFGVRR